MQGIGVRVAVKVGYRWPGVYRVIGTKPGGRYIIDTGESLGRVFQWEDLEIVSRDADSIPAVDTSVKVAYDTEDGRRWFVGNVKRNQATADVVVVTDPGTTDRPIGSLVRVPAGVDLTVAAPAVP